MNESNSKTRPSSKKLFFSSLVLGCSLIVLVLSGVRQLTSNDLGYHLAFGETFFETGRIVDHTPFIYTLPSPDTAESERLEPGPGNWYDEQGRYRFPNANWLSQILFYGAWRLAGITGLNILRVILVAGLFIFLAAAMLQNRIPPLMAAPALLLAGLAVSSRLDLRPELLGYICLIGQYLLLSRLTRQTGRQVTPSPGWMAGMAAIQLLFVNLHSYFVLGLAITGAVLVEHVLLAFRNGFLVKNMRKFESHKKTAFRLGLTVTAMILSCFIRPFRIKTPKHFKPLFLPLSFCHLL